MENTRGRFSVLEMKPGHMGKAVPKPEHREPSLCVHRSDLARSAYCDSIDTVLRLLLHVNLDYSLLAVGGLDGDFCRTRLDSLDHALAADCRHFLVAATPGQLGLDL